MKLAWLIVPVVLCSSVICDLVRLHVLRCDGAINLPNGREHFAVFLSGPKLTVEEQTSNTITLHGLVPLVLDQFPESLVIRDNGVYDNLPYDWADNRSAKQQMYKRMSSASTDGYPSLVESMAQVLNAKVKQLNIEEWDARSDQIMLGASIVVSGEHAQRVRTINCHLDEVVGLSSALNMPIYMQKSLYNAVSIDAELRNEPSLCIHGRYTGPTKRVANSKPIKYPPAWEIFDPQVYFDLRTDEKREILRASGVKNLPKPRLGVAALNAILLDLMDDAVRCEIFRLQDQYSRNSRGAQAEIVTTGSTLTDSLPKAESVAPSRAALLHRVGQALQQNDLNSATKLRDLFSQLTALRADPTQSEGSYDPYLDQDDWYMRARQKSMGK